MALGESAGTVKTLDHERLSRIASCVPVGFLEADAGGDLTWASSRFYELAGIDADLASRRGWLNAVDSRDRARVEQAWRDAVSSGVGAELHFRFARLTGTVHARLLMVRLTDSGGVITGFAASVTDITQFIEKEAFLEQAGEQFRAMAEAMPQLAWIADADGTIEYYNTPWIQYTGLSVDDMRAKGPKGVVHPDELGLTWERWSHALATGNAYEQEYRLRRKSDGAYRWFIARAMPVRDAAGRIHHWIGTATDIDTQKRANANLRFVIDASAGFESTYDVNVICRMLANLAVNRVADWCFISLFERGKYTTAALGHRDPSRLHYVEQFRDMYPVREGSPLDQVVRTNAPLLVPNVSPQQLRDAAQDEKHLDVLESLQMRSVMIVPLSTESGPAYGAISVASSESGRNFTTEDLEVLRMVARRAAAAIHTAKAFEQERLRAERSRFIARASELVFESLDLQSTFDSLTEFIVTEMADLAYVMLIEDGSILRTISCAHHDPGKASIAARLRGQRTLRLDAEERAIQTLSHRRAVLQSKVTLEDSLPEMWEYLSADVRQLNIHSAITIPLYSRGETLGALVVCWSDSPKHYAETDLPVFLDLGRRLSIAIEHASTLQRERRIAEALQQALLPAADRLPQQPGISFNTEYRPSSHEADVGGDWYDAVTLPDGSIMISVGDVTGRGLAAAGLMGTLRQAINMASMYERDPARILDAVDFQLRSRDSQSIATAFIGFIDVDHKTLRYANAGHPAPLLRGDGWLHALHTGGLPLGLRDSAEPERSESASLKGAQLLALYTDGLVEGTRDLAFGERRLRSAILSQAILFVRNPARLLCDACLPFEAQDDTAVLTVLFGARTDWSFDAENAQAAHDARAQFVAALRERAPAASDFSAAELVFGELIGNVVRHAPGPIDVQLDWSGRSPVLHVTDRGKGFIRDAALPADVLSESGRGLYIISELTEALEIERIPGYGNHVTARLRI